MPNFVIAKPNGVIVDFIEDCVKSGSSFIGSKTKIAGMKTDGLLLRWTNDTTNPVRNADGDIVGYDKTFSQLTDAWSGPEIKSISHADYAAAIKLREVISNLTYSEIDGMVDTIFSALTVAQKNFLKNHAKATLAIARIMDRRI